MSKILVVDDEEPICRLYQEVLSREGHMVKSVSNGEEALTELQGDSEYDLMVLDIELENESGLEILKKIKKHVPNISVILNSAYSVYKSDFSSWIADAYVLKSSDMKPLIDKINELVGV